MPNLRDTLKDALKDFSFKALPTEARRGITVAAIVILVILLGLGTWGVHSLLDYPWLQCFLLAPVFLAAIIGLLVLGLYMMT